MVKDASIFSLRFGSNVTIDPSPDDLRHFLESRKEGSREVHGDDLKPYWNLLSEVAAHKTAARPHAFSERMLYTVLSHSHFAKPALKSVVEQYKYHVHVLRTIDFKKPSAFIASAEQEITRLSPRKKEEAARIERLRGMIEERKHLLEVIRKRVTETAEELSHILAYVAGNLAKIEKLCEQSIGILVNEQIDRTKESILIEDIKTHYKERLRESLHQGTIRKADLEAAKEEVTDLSRRTADLVRSDIYTMTQLYERIHEHARNIVRELRALEHEIGLGKHESYDRDVELYGRGETVLVSLVAACRFDVAATEIGMETEPEKLLAEKRGEIFDHLVGLLQKE